MHFIGLLTLLQTTFFTPFALKTTLVFRSGLYEIITSLLRSERDGVVVKALASHQCGPGSNPGVDGHMWVECVVGSLLCSERLFSGYSGFFPLLKNQQFQFDQESGRRRTTLWMCYLQIIIYLFII